MTAELNHIIVQAHEKRAAAEFLARILDLEVGADWGPFVPVRLGNGVTLDFSDAEEVRPRHFAFLVSEPEFDAALARIRKAGVAFFAEHDRSGSGTINRHYGGRGVYFDDPSGHWLEIITRPYGATPEG